MQASTQGLWINSKHEPQHQWRPWLRSGPCPWANIVSQGVIEYGLLIDRQEHWPNQTSAKAFASFKMEERRLLNGLRVLVRRDWDLGILSGFVRSLGQDEFLNFTFRPEGLYWISRNALLFGRLHCEPFLFGLESKWCEEGLCPKVLGFIKCRRRSEGSEFWQWHFQHLTISKDTSLQRKHSGRYCNETLCSLRRPSKYVLYSKLGAYTGLS